MEWRDRFNDFLEDLENRNLFEQSYTVTYPCRYKISGRWVRAKIDMKEKIVYDLKGKELRRCN